MRIILAIVSLFLSVFLKAQDPVKWVFTAKKISDKKYELHITAKVEPSWHTYSQTTPEGGPLPTKITFIQNPLLHLEGKPKEEGDLHKIHDETFDVDVKYFDGTVDFVQTITVKAAVKTTIRGSVEFMACNDHQCLPPKTIPFSVDLQ